MRPLSLVAARPLGGTALTQSTSAQKAAGYSPQAYLDYVSWEREVKRPDTPLVKGIFERAVADHPTEIDLWDEYLGFLVRSPSSSSAVSSLPRAGPDSSVPRSTRSPRRTRTCATCPRRRSATSRRRPRSGPPPCVSLCVLLHLSSLLASAYTKH